jgi:hypothetical protein
MLVQCGALPCGAVQCSAAQTADLYVRTKYTWAGERTGRSFYASTPLRRTECHALTPPVPAGCRPQLPSSGHLPSSLHIPGRSAPCPPRLSTHTGSPPRASPVRDFPAVQGSPLLGASPPLLYSGPPHHPVLRFRSRGLLGCLAEK